MCQKERHIGRYQPRCQCFSLTRCNKGMRRRLRQTFLTRNLPTQGAAKQCLFALHFPYLGSPFFNSASMWSFRPKTEEEMDFFPGESPRFDRGSRQKPNLFITCQKAFSAHPRPPPPLDGSPIPWYSRPVMLERVFLLAHVSGRAFQS